MKPRIIKIMGIWTCRHPAWWYEGLGFTASVAYENWVNHVKFWSETHDLAEIKKTYAAKRLKTISGRALGI